MKLTVLSPGIYSTIQDVGRAGYRSLGIPTCGFLDRKSAYRAHTLVGNSIDSALIEMTAKGLTASISENCMIAVTGGLCQVMINHQVVNHSSTLHLRKGDELRIGTITKGFRAYLAIAGKIQGQRDFGSISTYSLARFGGLNGTPIKKGDDIYIIPSKRDQNFPHELGKTDLELSTIPFYPGPEWHLLSQPHQQKLLSTQFKVSPQSNRMGLRLNAEINPWTYPPYLSTPVLVGTIQLPPDGQPIILLADGQTTGGYPRVGQIAADYIDALAQLRPGTEVNLVQISEEFL